MGKTKNNFTYVVGLEGGVEEGPLTWTDLQPMLRTGRVVGSTFIKRSDRMEWTTAADLPELKVKDVIEGKDLFGPDAVTQEIVKELHLRKVRSGVSWLFWIGALSLLNSGLAALGVGKSYAMGLGAAHLITALGDHFGSSAVVISLGVNVALALSFLLVGVLAWHGRPWLLGPALAVYVADTILSALFEQWLSVGLHALALVFLTPGFVASYGARGLELTWRGWAMQGAIAVALSGAGFGSLAYLEKSLKVEPAKWASSPPAQWPIVSLANDAEFKGRTRLAAGNAFFIRLKSGKVLAATARHLLGPDGGVEPEVKLSELDSTLSKWTVAQRNAPAKSARIRGLHGAPGDYRALADWVLLEVHPDDVAKLPAEPLSPRLTIVEEGETIYMIGTGARGAAQEVYRAKVVEADDWSVEGQFEQPIDLVGFSGSPVVDAYGNLVGVLTSSHAEPDKQGKLSSFVADSTLEVKRLLK